MDWLLSDWNWVKFVVIAIIIIVVGWIAIRFPE